MVVEHIVLLKTSRPFNQDEIRSIGAAIMSIPGVLSISVGNNYTTRGLEYTSGIVVRLKDKDTEKAYQMHPEHIRVRDELIKPVLRKGTDTTPPVIAMDYVFDAPEPEMSKTVLLCAAFGALGVAAGMALSR